LLLLFYFIIVHTRIHKYITFINYYCYC